MCPPADLGGGRHGALDNPPRQGYIEDAGAKRMVVLRVLTQETAEDSYSLRAIVLEDARNSTRD